jgi:hypothetical protein
MQFKRRIRRSRLIMVAISAIAAASLVAPTAVLGATRERSQYQLQFDGVLDCGTFQDVFTDYYDVRETDVFDAAGNLLRIVYQAEHHSDDRNSITGVVVHEHGHFTEVDDFVARTITITGAQEVINVPGRGVRVQDTGRIVFTFDGDLVFFAGGRKHSEIIIGDSVLCDALS